MNLEYNNRNKEENLKRGINVLDWVIDNTGAVIAYAMDYNPMIWHYAFIYRKSKNYYYIINDVSVDRKYVTKRVIHRRTLHKYLKRSRKYPNICKPRMWLIKDRRERVKVKR